MRVHLRQVARKQQQAAEPDEESRFFEPDPAQPSRCVLACSYHHHQPCSLRCQNSWTVGNRLKWRSSGWIIRKFPCNRNRAGLAARAPASDSDEDAPVVVGEDGMEEVAVDDDFRSQFPMAFGTMIPHVAVPPRTLRSGAGDCMAGGEPLACADFAPPSIALHTAS